MTTERSSKQTQKNIIQFANNEGECASERQIQQREGKGSQAVVL